MSYLTLKSVHLLGVMLFLGNIIVTGWWKFMADRTGEPKVIAFAQRQVTLTDWVFTFGGVVVLYIAGEWMARVHLGDAWTIPWLMWGRSLFIASGLIWVAILIPVQIKQARMARAFADGSPIPDDYWRLTRIWNLWGSIAVLLPLGNLYWMVFKPV